MEDNLYDTLGVDKNFTEQELKDAYRKAAKENHEDKGGDKDKMVAINKAYAVLKDPKKKEHYDKTGQTEPGGFEKRFAELIQVIFMQIIEKVDVTKVDIIDLFKQNIDGMIDKSESAKDQAERTLTKMNQVLERLTVENSSLIHQVLTNNVVQTQKNIIILENDIQMLNDCLEVLNSSHYKFEAQEMRGSMDSTDYFTFRI